MGEIKSDGKRLKSSRRGKKYIELDPELAKAFQNSSYVFNKFC